MRLHPNQAFVRAVCRRSSARSRSRVSRNAVRSSRPTSPRRSRRTRSCPWPSPVRRSSSRSHHVLPAGPSRRLPAVLPEFCVLVLFGRGVGVGEDVISRYRLDQRPPYVRDCPGTPVPAPGARLRGTASGPNTGAGERDAATHRHRLDPGHGGCPHRGDLGGAAVDRRRGRHPDRRGGRERGGQRGQRGLRALHRAQQRAGGLRQGRRGVRARQGGDGAWRARRGRRGARPG